MTLTARGRFAVVTAAGALAFLAGATAERWDPYAAGLARCFEDGSCDDGSCRAGAACDDSADMADDGPVRPVGGLSSVPGPIMPAESRGAVRGVQARCP